MAHLGAHTAGRSDASHLTPSLGSRALAGGGLDILVPFLPQRRVGASRVVCSLFGTLTSRYQSQFLPIPASMSSWKDAHLSNWHQSFLSSFFFNRKCSGGVGDLRKKQTNTKPGTTCWSSPATPSDQETLNRQSPGCVSMSVSFSTCLTSF